MNIYLDMDGVLAEWNVHASKEDTRKNGYYLTCTPTKLALEIKNYLQNAPLDIRKRLFINSAYYTDTPALYEKQAWCELVLPEIPCKNRIFTPFGDNVSKSSAAEKLLGRCLTKEDVLIDDYTPNLREWQIAGGTAVKYMNGINGTHGTWDGLRFSNFREFFGVLKNGKECA